MHVGWGGVTVYTALLQTNYNAKIIGWRQEKNTLPIFVPLIIFGKNDENGPQKLYLNPFFKVLVPTKQI